MKNEIIEAECKVVQERTLEVIATEIRTIDNHVCQVALNGAIEIGQKLTEAKEKIGHGNWENWCKENLDYSKSKAERFMRISIECGAENSPYFTAISKTSTLTDFSISKALALLSLPEDDVESFAEEHDVSDMTVKNLEAEIKKLKEEKDTLTDDYTAAAEDVEMTDKLLKEAEEKLQAAEAEKEAAYLLLQELQEKELEANNAESEPSPEALALQSEIENLKADVEKAKKKEEKLKAEKDKLKADKDAEIEAAKKQALAEATEAALKRAEEQMGEKVTEYAAKAEAALSRAMEAERNLEITGSEALTKRKVNMDLIEKLAAEVVGVIKEMRESDSEKAEEISRKTKLFILTLVDLF